MESIDYSVVIRTIGKAGNRYQQLLNSIQNLKPAPREVIVVLPEGFDLPPEKLGYEVFSFSPKGMVSQRMAGINLCQSPYALVCDDDVCFGPDFVQKLYVPIKQGLGLFSAGPLYSFLPAGKVHIMSDAVMGRAAPTVFHRDRYVSVLNTTGYSYNRHLKADKKYYESQSLAGTCFFADVKAMKEVDLSAEIWIDKNGYSAMEDQVLFYKAWLRGKKAIVVEDAFYEHLDAKTSIQNNKPSFIYSLRFNRAVFWKRFIYEQKKSLQGRIWAKLCFEYRLFWEKIYERVSVSRGRMTKEDGKIARQGWKDAFRYFESKEYSCLPPVC
ncbi:MAG: hypothetical protein K5637_07955 [Lachnospiraceae bacterium]|nr:hypothetical protein [Lachnospiraceae bacterium]